MNLLRTLPLSALLLASLATLACVSTTSAPPELHPEPCVVDQELPGTWTDTRASSLGPGRMKLRFACDCTYSARVSLTFFRHREEGSYWVEDGHLVFTRASGETTSWPYRVEGDALILHEGDPEPHRYRRGERLSCPEG